MKKFKRPPRTKELNQKYNSTLKARFCRLKASTKIRGHEVFISFQEFELVTNKPCVYCRNILCEPSKQGSNLDRIDNSKPYTIDNIQPCCKICNSIRNEFLTVEETHIMIRTLLNLRGL